MAVSITRKPSPAPSGLRMTQGDEHDGASVKAEWGVPADALWESSHQWAALDEYWDFNASKNMDKTRYSQRGESHICADHIWVRDKGANHSTDTVWYDRTKYHPLTYGRYLNSVTCQLRATNGKGATTAERTFTFSKPPRPTCEVAYDEDGGSRTITWTLKRPERFGGTQEMYDMSYYLTRQDGDYNADYVKEKTVVGPYSTTLDEITVSRNMGQGQMSNEAWVRFKLKAISRGVKGDSDIIVSQYVFARPARAQILKITHTGWESEDFVRIYIKTNHNANTHPVDTVKLQRLWNTSITSVATAWQSEDWEDVDGAVDDFNCVGFCDLMEDAKPDVNKHTWYRVITEHAGFTRPSEPMMAKCINHTNSRLDDDKVRFQQLYSGDDGESVTMLLGWKNDDSTSTEIAWSKYEDAWRSNEQPQFMTVTWEDSTSQVPGWAHSARVTIRGIEQGEPLYVRARRVLDEGVETPQYGPWCFPATGLYPILPDVAPLDVVLTAPESVERGKGINCMWTFTGGEQTEWTMYDKSVSPAVVVASGVGSEGGCVVPARVLRNKTKVRLAVSVSTGGNSAFSNVETVEIRERPTLSIAIGQRVTAQPISIVLTSNSAVASVGLWVTSHGVGANNPSGDNDQPSGDILWATSVTPDWVAANQSMTSWTATIVAPQDLDLRDGANYTVSAVSTVGGLSSDEASAGFTVLWAHQAVAPDASSTVTPNPANLTTTIVPVAPSGAAETDVCDIYRETPDGYYLIAESIPFGNTVVDPYAPFSNLPDAVTAYLLCTRTVDGDIEWREVEYEMKASILRLDWDGMSVELPYNVTNSTSFEKPFELQRRLDGSQVGGWDAGASRTEQITLDLARNSMWDEARLIRQLGKYSGPCFVRTHDGCAYEADVQVDSMELSYNGGSVPVSLRIQEIGLTDEFKQEQTETGSGN